MEIRKKQLQKANLLLGTNIMLESEFNQLEDLPISEWRRAVQEAVIKNELERRDLNQRLETNALERQQLSEEEQFIEQAIRLCKARLVGQRERPNLLGNNLREILIIHFADHQGTIEGANASKSLVDLGYFSDRRAADGAIYTTLGKQPFTRIRRGVYQIALNSGDWVRLRGASKNGAAREEPKQQQKDPPQHLTKARQQIVVAKALELGGYIRHTPATKALEEAGYERSAKQHVANILTKSGLFHKTTEKGLYKLDESVSQQIPLMNLPAVYEASPN